MLNGKCIDKVPSNNYEYIYDLVILLWIYIYDLVIWLSYDLIKVTWYVWTFIVRFEVMSVWGDFVIVNWIWKNVIMNNNRRRTKVPSVTMTYYMFLSLPIFRSKPIFLILN